MPSAPERFGDYLVHEALGKGGMATVHRAELPQRNGTMKQVALKRLIPTLQKELVTQFLDEARVLKYLHHPNLVETYDSGKLFGTYFIAMEYVKGPTLKDVLAHCGATVGGMPQPVALNLAAQLCEALDHAHNQKDEKGKPLGIVHRDVTPSNMIVQDTGALKLIDFGLAKSTVTLGTEHNVIKGKFSYVAPEYLEGRIDHRADLWALGIVMYELLTGRRLFSGFDNAETIMRIKSLPIPRPSLANPRVTPELDRIVMTALSRDPDQRWQSAAEIRDALRGVMEQPGNRVDNGQVAAWISWAFAQRPGTDVSGMAGLQQIVPELAPPPPPQPPPPVPTTSPVASAREVQPISPNIPIDRRWLWVIGGVLLLVLIIVASL